MPDLSSDHRATLERALAAMDERTYWSAFPEHPKAYGEGALERGQADFEALLGSPFTTDQRHDGYLETAETSPFGIDLGVTYPATSVDATIRAAIEVMGRWGRTTPDDRAEVCLELLDRLAQASFTMAHAIMHTTGQSFLMAFQAGGPHALDRGLEAVVPGGEAD